MRVLMKGRVSKYPLLNGFPIALFPSRKPDDPWSTAELWTLDPIGFRCRLLG